jgi:predicted Zn-dependent peptidase
MNVIESAFFKEKVLYKQLPNGVRCYIIPKKGFYQNCAAVSVNYGGADCGSESEPRGCAHFLEHLTLSGAVLSALSEKEASANAFTTKTATVFYAKCGKGPGALKTLLGALAGPDTSVAAVEREKPIILAEIRQLEADAAFAARQALAAAMYGGTSPFAASPAGLAESALKITPDILEGARRSRYIPGSITISFAGDAEADEIFLAAEAAFPASPEAAQPRPYAGGGVSAAFARFGAGAANPLFAFGIKDADLSPPFVKRAAAASAAFDLALGESSDVFAALAESGVLNPRLCAAEYEGSLWHGAYVCQGGGGSPQKVFEAFSAELRRIKRSGFAPGGFERIKRKRAGQAARRFSLPFGAALFQADCAVNGINAIEMAEAFVNLTEEDAAAVIAERGEQSISFAVSAAP